jgi:hypothetical protein
MDGTMVGAPAAFGPLGLIQKGYIICGWCICVEIFETYVHGSYGYSKIFKAGEEIEEMMGSKGKLGGLDIMRGKSQVREG